jgi:hypothetical protein
MKYRKTVYTILGTILIIHFINNHFNGNSFSYSNDTGRLETLYYFYFECVINYL